MGFGDAINARSIAPIFSPSFWKSRFSRLTISCSVISLLALLTMPLSGRYLFEEMRRDSCQGMAIAGSVMRPRRCKVCCRFEIAEAEKRQLTDKGEDGGGGFRPPIGEIGGNFSTLLADRIKLLAKRRPRLINQFVQS